VGEIERGEGLAQVVASHGAGNVAKVARIAGEYFTLLKHLFNGLGASEVSGDSKHGVLVPFRRIAVFCLVDETASSPAFQPFCRFLQAAGADGQGRAVPLRHETTIEP
jgi:hypothetical protein